MGDTSNGTEEMLSPPRVGGEGPAGEPLAVEAQPTDTPPQKYLGSQAIEAEGHSSETQQSKPHSSSSRGETIDISEDTYVNVRLPEPQAGDLFEWEQLACDPPYHLQGDASFETPEKYAERQALKAHPEVQAALEHVWSLFSKNDENHVTKTEYFKVLLRICLVLVPELRGKDAMKLIEEDWLHDSKGAEALSFNAFYESFFELADIWTPAIDGTAYAEFLRRLFRRITIKKAQAEPKLKSTKIKPKIVVKVLNQSIKKPEVQEDDKKDAQRVDLLIDSNGATSCVAEWSKAEHEAVEAMLIAHISGESKELDQLQLEEEVLHDCTAVSPEDAVSTEWAEFTDIAPLGAASRAFLQSVFSKAIAKIIQSQQEQKQEHANVETEVVAEKTDLPSVSSEGEGQAKEECPTQAIEAARPPFPQPPSRRHFAEYHSKSDLPVQVEAVSEEELRPFNSVGVPVQLEGVRKLVRLKAVVAPPHEDLQAQPSSEEAQKVHSQPEAPQAKEETTKVYHVDESQAALLRDLSNLENGEPPLEENEKALDSNLVAKGDPESVSETTLHQLPEPEIACDPGPETEPESNLEDEAELRRSEPELEPDVQFEPEPELEPEPGETKEESSALEKSSTPQTEVALEPESPTHEATEEAPSTTLKSEQLPKASRFAAHRPTHFQTKVFHSLREESLKQMRSMSFRKSIIITGVGAVAVRRRSDYKDLLSRQNRSPSHEPKAEPDIGSASDTAAGPLDCVDETSLVEGQAEEDPWQNAYAEPEKPAQEHAIVVTEEDEVAFAQQPRQAILILGPNGSEKSRVAYKLATNMGLEWLQAEYLLSALCKISRHLLTPLGRRLTRMMRRGSEVPVLEGLLLTLEFMASKRSRSAGYVLELPNGDKQDIRAFLRHLRDLSGRRTLNWPELLLRHARICEQRFARRKEEKRQRRLQAAMKQREQVDAPALRKLQPDVEQSDSKDGGSSAVSEGMRAMEGTIDVLEGAAVSESHEISALADLATRPPRAPLKDDSRKDAADPLSDENEVTKAALGIQDTERLQPPSYSNSPSADASEPAVDDIAAEGAAADTREELQEDAGPNSSRQSQKDAREQMQDKIESSDPLAASDDPLRGDPSSFDSSPSAKESTEAADIRSSNLDATVIDPGGMLPAHGEDSQRKKKTPDESDEARADGTPQTASALPATGKIASDPQRNTDADSEVLSSDSSDSDTEADAVYEKAARDSSQPQANPLMDAFPGRAVILQIDSQDSARALMLDAINGDVIDEIRDDEKTGIALYLINIYETVEVPFDVPYCFRAEKEDDESDELDFVDLGAKTDVLEELRRAIPPSFTGPPPSETILLQTEDQRTSWLSQRLLLQQLLQALGPNRVLYYPSPEADVEDKGALEAQLVLAGSRIEAALEFLSARPPGEVAVPVPGAGEAEELCDLLQRAELIQDSEGAEGEADEEPGNEDNVGISDTGSASAEGQTLRQGSQGGTDQDTLVVDAQGTPRTSVPLNKYSMADDLWGESQLEVEGSASPDTDKKGDNDVDALFQRVALSSEESTVPHVGSSSPYSADELQRLFERKWTAWGPFCPVTLKEGKVQRGKKEYAVDFAGKIFLLADEEKQARFLEDPKRYVDVPPCIPPTTSVYIFGPSYAGISKQARLLSRAYGLLAVDVSKELADGHRRAEEEKQRILEEKERRRLERVLQERLRKQALREEEERRLMAAEDDAQRLAVMASSARDELPQDTTQLEESPKESTPTAPFADEPVSAEVKGLQVVAPQTTEGRTVEDARTAHIEERFILSQEEETLLQDGQSLGTDTTVRLILQTLGITANLEIADAIDQYESMMEDYKNRYEGQAPDESDNLADGENEDLIGNASAGGTEGAAGASPGPPVAPPSLLRPERGIVLAGGPPSRELLQRLARVGVQFDHLIHITSNPSDIEEAEAAGATQFAFRDTEILFEDEPENPEVDAPQQELEKEADDSLILDIDEEPAKIEASLTDLLKHYKIRQLVDPFCIKPDEPDSVKAPPNLEEVWDSEACEEWESAAQTFPFLPPLPLVLYGSPGSQADKRVMQLSSLYAVPVVDLRAAFPTALLRQMRLHLRQVRRAALEEAIAEMNEEVRSPLEAEDEDLTDHLLSLSSSEFVNSPVDTLKQSWASLQEETQQTLYQEALRTLLHPMMGPAFIQAGPVTNPLVENEETHTEEDIPSDSVDIGRLMDASARLPDCVIIFLCSNDVAVQRCLDLEQISREADEARRQKQTERRLRQKDTHEAVADEEREKASDGSDEESDDPRAACERARDEFVKSKSVQDAVLLRSAKSFAAAGVPVLVVRSELCEGTLMAAVKHFLDRFMNYRRSLLLSPQCISLPKRLLRTRAARLSMYLLCSPMDVDSPRKKHSTEFPVLFRDRIYFPGDTEEARQKFCRCPSKYLTGVVPPPRQYVPACVFLGPLNSNRSQVGRLRTNAPISFAEPDLWGKQIAACCLSRLIAARVQSSEAKQRGFILDGCGMEGVDVQQLLELLQADLKTTMDLAAKHANEHGDNGYSSHLTEESVEAVRPSVPPAPPSAQPSTPRSLSDGEPSRLEPARGALISEGMVGSPSANLKAVVPPLHLNELRDSAAVDVEEKYSTPAASSEDGVLAASQNVDTSASAGPEITERQVVEQPNQLSEASEAKSLVASEQQAALIDAVFVFQPEKEDMYSVEQRVLLERYEQETAGSPTSARLRYPHGDDRDILIHSDLAEYRRMRQEAATKQQAERFSSAGALIVEVPAGGSEWLQFDVAHKIIDNVLRRRHIYERLSSQGKAARCPRKSNVSATFEGPFAAYCPVCLTVNIFLNMPEAYLHRRLPALLPTRPPEDNKQPAVSGEAVALKGYCPATLVSTGELTKGCLDLLATYGGQTYAFASEEALQRFMLHPAGYTSHAQLTARLNEIERLRESQCTLASIAHEAHARCMQAAQNTGPSTDPLVAEEGLAELRDQVKDALTYIEISSVDLLIEGLLFAGKRRLLHPQFNPISSTVQLLAHFLNANNPVISGHAKANAQEALRNFLGDCETPFEARKAIVQRHYHANQGDFSRLSDEQQKAFKIADCSEVQKQEWTYFSELQYERVTKRLDKLFHA
ncbi:hypothetical protein Emed_001784 [Eimeria media]